MTPTACLPDTDPARSTRRWRTAGALAALLALTACGNANGDNGKDAADKGVAAAVPVEVAATKRAEMAAIYTGTAPVEAERKAFVMPKVKGEIRSVLADEGKRVREGEVLARLDGDQLRLEVALAAATMRKLERDFERNTELQDKGLISAVSIDNLKYELEAAKASWELAQLQLSYTNIRSPISGTVTQRLDVVKVGNTVTPVGGVIESADSSLFVVEDLDSLILRVNVPERELAKLSVGQLAELSFDAVPGRTFAGEIALISPYVDAATATFGVRIRVTETGGLLRPGMFARVAIVYERKLDALQIPRTALLDGDGPPKVFVVQDGKAAERSVSLGLSNGAMIEVVEGLKDGEQVVVVGQGAVKPGAAVRIVNTPARPAAATSTAAKAG
ncbi:MAG: efflux RND transporter periplasmic adaptor subunit [Pseudomonadota bacterium]|nr:efflux RND transporter periplasmic adaptor subunit [Pseudomonadota bacterium]